MKVYSYVDNTHWWVEARDDLAQHYGNGAMYEIPESLWAAYEAATTAWEAAAGAVDDYVKANYS